MKFIFVLLFIGFCECSDEDVEENSNNYWIGHDYDDYEEKYVQRPCPTFELDCIRHYFAKNAHCSPAYDKVPDPLYLAQMSLPLANSNITFVLIKVQVKGLNGKVVEFYVNEITDRVVLAVELRNLTLFSPAGYLRFHRKAKEPVVTSDFAIVTYKYVTLTAVLPHIDNIQLNNAEINAFIDDSDPRNAIGPNAVKSKDPVVLRSFTHLMKNVNENVREAFVVQAPIFLNLFIQKRICDFGLKVVSH